MEIKDLVTYQVHKKNIQKCMKTEQCIFIKFKVLYTSVKGSLFHYQREGSCHLDSCFESMYCSTLTIPLPPQSKNSSQIYMTFSKCNNQSSTFDTAQLNIYFSVE